MLTKNRQSRISTTSIYIFFYHEQSISTLVENTNSNLYKNKDLKFKTWSIASRFLKTPASVFFHHPPPFSSLYTLQSPFIYFSIGIKNYTKYVSTIPRLLISLSSSLFLTYLLQPPRYLFLFLKNLLLKNTSFSHKNARLIRLYLDNTGPYNFGKIY